MSGMITRREWLAAVAALPALPALPALLGATDGPAMVVYKDPNCGCCGEWVEHARKAGFTVSVRNTGELAAVKRRYRVPAALGSCHTAVVAGYVVEGHVPADLVHRMLREKPKVAGLAVPGMPQGSPGMETGQREPYQVLTFDATGKTTVYARR